VATWINLDAPAQSAVPRAQLLIAAACRAVPISLTAGKHNLATVGRTRFRDAIGRRTGAFCDQMFLLGRELAVCDIQLVCWACFRRATSRVRANLLSLYSPKPDTIVVLPTAFKPPASADFS